MNRPHPSLGITSWIDIWILGCRPAIWYDSLRASGVTEFSGRRQNIFSLSLLLGPKQHVNCWHMERAIERFFSSHPFIPTPSSTVIPTAEKKPMPCRIHSSMSWWNLVTIWNIISFIVDPRQKRWWHLELQSSLQERFLINTIIRTFSCGNLETCLYRRALTCSIGLDLGWSAMPTVK